MPIHARFTDYFPGLDHFVISVDTVSTSLVAKWGDDTYDVLEPLNGPHLRFGAEHAYGSSGHRLDGVYTIRVIDLATGESDKLVAQYFPGADDAKTLTGSDASDLLVSGSRADHLDGGRGQDVIYGGDGADVLSGGAAADLILTGSGDDTVFGGGGDDSITATSSGAHLLNGGGGDDSLQGDNGGRNSVGGDTLRGGVGNDTLTLTTASSPDNPKRDHLLGGSGDDKLSGDLGTDELHGGSGADTLAGGLGNDILNLGKDDGSRDVVVYHARDEGQDKIRDFTPGEDVIALNFIPHSADPHFLAGADPVSGGTGVWLLYDTDDGRLTVDIDGTGGKAAIALATLKDVPAITLADFTFGT